MNYAQENARLLKAGMQPGHLLVNEAFGPTLQGEGPTIGYPCTFLRLATCNQHCSFCDTPYTWKWDAWDPDLEVHSLSYEQVIAELYRFGLKDTQRVIVSGGEPMLQWRQLLGLFDMLDYRVTVEIETAGTIAPQRRTGSDLMREYAYVIARPIRFNVSPKLENSGNPKQQRYRPKALRMLNTFGATFKFVVVEPADFVEIDEIVAECGITADRVYVMPEGVTAADVQLHAQMVAAEVLQRGWRLTTRLQVQLWGQKRGV